MIPPWISPITKVITKKQLYFHSEILDFQKWVSLTEGEFK